MKTWCWIFASLLMFTGAAHSMTVGTLKVKKKAFFVQGQNGLFKSLDLKKKKVKFSAADFGKCGNNLQRKFDTLSYSCKLKIPSKANVSKLRKVLSPQKMLVRFGRTEQLVRLKISKDARYITFSTEFDDTGYDLEVNKFNDDFYGVFAKAAQLIITEAMDQNPLIVTVLESKI